MSEARAKTRLGREPEIDLAGRVFGRLTVLRRGPRPEQAGWTWVCRCECGKELSVPGRNLRWNVTRSCGCLALEVQIANGKAGAGVEKPHGERDLAGRRFGRLTAIEIIGHTKVGLFLWLCECDCGQEVKVGSRGLRSGRKRSCGCLAIDVAREMMLRREGRRRVDLTGQRFGSVTVLGPVEDGTGWRKWRVRCGCGAEYTLNLSNARKARKCVSCRGAQQAAREKERAPRYGGRTVREIAEASGVPWETVRRRARKGWPVERLGEPVPPRASREK